MSPAANPAKTLARGATHISKRLIFSYVFDWICILWVQLTIQKFCIPGTDSSTYRAIAGVGGAFNKLHSTNKRPFALQDPSISYPYKPDTVTFGVLLIVALVAPAVITLVAALLFIPGGGTPKGTPQALIWRRKLWEWNTAWMGLALALASAFMITEGLKDLAGKPRPHMLAACRPNLDNIGQYQVGGIGTTLNGAVPVMVDYHICQETDAQQLRNMFASWPSGHSSFSWAGLLYLTLWVSSKFAVTIPYLHPSFMASNGRRVPTFGPPQPLKGGLVDSHDSENTEFENRNTDISNVFKNSGNPPRNQAAAPPVYLLILAFVPIGTAAFIAVSRWFDFHHHGFDIISGSLLGIFTAWFSFRYYHLPINRGAGWSWGARTRSRAYWLGVGRDTYVGEEGWESKKYASQISHTHHDVESGRTTGVSTENRSTEPGPSAM